MADSKITALTSIGASTDPANDPLVLVDVSDTSMAASGTTKKVTLNQLLGASGTATLASATITGDLTVDTSTLKVDSTNNRVGIGTATPSTALHVGSGTGLNNLGVGLSRGATTNFYEAFDGTKTFLAGTDSSQAGVKVGSLTNHSLFLVCNNTTQLQIDPLGVFSFTDGAGGTRMTLNSTGLGVGGSVVNKMTVTVAPGTSTSDGLRVTDSTRSIISGQTGATYSYLGIGGNQNLIYTSGGRLDIAADGQSLFLRTGTNNYLNLDATGNVGIGGTPQAWNTSYKGVQVGLGANFYTNAGTPNNGWFATNTYQNAANTTTFIGTGYGMHYRHLFGEHAWLTSTVSGSAGGTATMTQMMTLDASGNLLVGKTAIGTANGIEVRPDGYLLATRSATTDGAGFTNAVYSSGAAAYRFYVGMGGTVFATNTTISGISDARLKENVQDLDVGLGAILALKPRKFDWKEGKGKNIKGDRGFIAQEFETVFPQLVDEWADPAPEGEAPYKSVRQDLIPVLVKAIQELAAEVNALKNA